MVKSKFYNLDTDETLASNSDYYIPSQKATKAYVDNISITQTNTISDCILEIPQNIKLTLENNLLTLKSGSILTVTGSTYATVTTSADKTYEISSSLADGKYIIFCTNTGAMHNPRILSKVSSGDSNSFPTDNLDGFNIYYNTDDKKIYSYNTSTLTWNEWTQIYPICLIEINTGVAFFAKDDNGYDIIFNSMCFMGKHAIAYPEIKGLIADGLNKDGTLKSKLYINSALQIIEIGNVNGYIISQKPLNANLSRTGSIIEVETLDDIDLSIMNWTRYYIKSLNKYYVHFSANLTAYEHLTIASFKADSNGIYNITIRQPVRLATTEITDKINADLSNVVHKSGTESITGQKTFTSDLVLERPSVQPILRSTSYEKATAPASDTYMCHRRYLDKNNKSVFSEYYYIPRNTNKPSYILRFYNVSTSDATGYKDVIAANYDGTNSIYAIGATTATGPHPATTNSTTSNNLTTVAWVNDPAKSTNVVHRTGDETITGAKIFDSSSVTINTNANGNGTGLIIQNKADNTKSSYLKQYLTSDNTYWTRLANNAYNKNTFIDLTTTENGFRTISLGSADTAVTVTPTDDNTTSKQIDTVGARNTKLQGYATTSLDNLNNTGQMIIDSQNSTISNCILDIPQNIKLTLENNVLTLKSGSIITLAGSTYTTVTTVQDNTLTIPTNDTWVVFPRSNGASIGNYVRLNRIGSGSTVPVDDTNYQCFFNTTDKKIYLYNNAWAEWNVGYPICVINVENGNMSFAKDFNGNDMIFNGAGFIGTTLFVYPNIKHFYAQGFNDNGTLKSELHTINALLLRPFSLNDNVLYAIGGNIGAGPYIYDKETNYLYVNSISEANKRPYLTLAGHIKIVSGIVTEFSFRQPVRLATTEMLDKVDSNIQVQLTLKADDSNVVHKTGNETIAGSKTFSNEVKMTAGGTSDISNGIVNSFKTNYAQATNFFTRNIIAGNSTSGSTVSTLPITFQKYGSITSQHPSDLSDLMRINLDGSIQTYGSYPHREGKIEGYDLTNPTVDFELGYQWIDNNGKFAGGLRYGVNSVGRKTLDLRFKKRDQNNISIGISEDADGTTYTFAPTPIRDNTSSTEIDTVGARNTKLQSYVPNTRTVNGKALSSNITLNASDVSALSSSTTINDLTTTAQQNALNSGITSLLVTQIGTNQTDISTINGKIPSAATTSNQLADKSFVNSSISTNTAYFIGTFNSVADLEAYSGTLTNNDYAFVISTDSAGNTVYNRYKYTTATNPSSWQFEYALNNSSFTSDQWAAINSGATPTNIGQIATNTGNISTLQSTKADDNAVVKLTGDQTVTGVKTFNRAIKLRNNVPNSLTATADGEQALTSITTNSDGVIDGASIVRIVKYNANGENRRFVAYRAGFRKADDSGNNWPGIFVGVDTDGKTFGQFDTNKAFAPTPSTTTSTSDTYIATTGWTNIRLTNYSLDTSVVHITGNETITGSKIFSSEIVNTNSADAFTSKDTNITRGTTPSTSRSDFITRIVGNNGTTLAGVLYRHYTANNNEFSLIAYDPTQSTGYTGDVISIGYNSSGNIYTKAPTPTTTTSTSDVNIATTGWVNTVGNNIVHLTGDETISGSKTFNNTIYRASDVTSAGGGGIVSYRLTDTNTTSSGYIYNIMYYVGNQVINRHTSRNSISDKDIYFDIISRDNGTGRISLGGSVTSFDNLNNVDSSTTSNVIATMGWVNNPLTSTNVVHRSGNETIAGVKTFSDNMNANGTITVGQHATMQYNSTTEALEFVFA